MPDDAEGDKPTKDGLQPRVSRGRHAVVEWGWKGLLAVIPALATGYFSVRGGLLVLVGAGLTLSLWHKIKKAAEESRSLAAYVDKLERRSPKDAAKAKGL